MKIIQFSDIHFGGDYNGRFACKLNFQTALRDAISKHHSLRNPVNLVVITGDLADKDYTDNYTDIKLMLVAADIPFIVMGGNHDDQDAMSTIFGSKMVPPYGSKVSDRILYWNNTDVECTEAPEGDYDVVFCHYPIGKVEHKFMESHALNHTEDLAEQLSTVHGVKHVFCGHFHWPSDTEVADGMTTHVCASTQCQLDPESEECNPIDYTPADTSSFPGYTVINIDENNVVKSIERAQVFVGFPRIPKKHK